MMELDKIYNMDCEVWKPAVGYEEYLEVSSFGNARRKAHSFIKSNGRMRKININNLEELKKFKLETSGFVSSYGFPYRLDDVTEKGANYTVFCPIRWKSAFSPAKLHKLLKEDVDAARPQRIKTHEEVLRERAAMEAYQRMSDAEKVAAGGNALAMGLIGIMSTCHDALQRRMKELEELKPYLDEIRETDKRFRNEEIKLSGFEW